MTKKIILFVCLFIFVGIMILFTLDFMSRTTPPWKRTNDSTSVSKYKVQYNEKLGLKNIDSLKKAREEK